jgi:transcriptional regulator with XRE-family HTH domain
MSENNQLGSYLRARRERVLPAEAGLPANGRRRVAGLRREEVALLAGISADYYLRLEQGRDQHPSAPVLDALAGALRLDDDATAYLHRLSAQRPRRRRSARRRPERVPDGVRQLVHSRSYMPAFVQGRYLDVLAANPLATALSPSYRVGTNLLRATFLDPEVRELYEDWESTSASVVAAVRALTGPDIDDPYLTELIGELSVRSEEFRGLWARHDVRPRTSGVSTLHHPQVGPIELSYEKLSVTGTDGQLLVVYHAAPGSAAEQALMLLAHLAASATGAGPQETPGPADRGGEHGGPERLRPSAPRATDRPGDGPPP